MEVVSVAAIRRSLTSLTTFDKVFGEGIFSRACMQEGESQMGTSSWENPSLSMSPATPPTSPSSKDSSTNSFTWDIQALSSKSALFDYHVQSVVHGSFKAEIETKSQRNHSNPAICDDKTLSCANKQEEHQKMHFWMLKKHDRSFLFWF